MHAKGPANLWEKKIGPFLIRERQARFRNIGEGYEVRFVFGLDTNVRLRTFSERQAAEAWIIRIFRLSWKSKCRCQKVLSA